MRVGVTRIRASVTVLVCLMAGLAVAEPASALVLGGKSYMPNGSGWGTAKPRAIFNGGAPSGAVDHIRWRNWGSRVASGRGRIALYKPGGGYYSKRGAIKLRAFEIGPCEGHRGYTRLSVSVPNRPGGPFGPWQPWAGDPTICGPGRVARSGALRLRRAARPPTPGEKKAIRRAAMRACRPQEVRQYKCKWRGHVMVSTINSRYAWAEVMGPQYDASGVLRRGKRHPGRWKSIRVVGGGIQPCSYWRSVVPPRVVTEFHIEGFTEGDEDFTYHPC
ncbi:MAG TPA: hypothetical protein VFX35_12420 [Solirubrobacterales bacterium]|nr:hypothetical protein [Solirubrobacterales bacterium]